MKFDFTPVEIVYDLDEEIKKKVYALYDKYLKSKTEASLIEFLSYIYETTDTINRREYFDLKLLDGRTVLDYFLDLKYDLTQENAKFIISQEDYLIKALLKGKITFGNDLQEDVLFKDINGKPLLEHLVNSQNFRPFILTCVQTRKEVIDILKRTNNTRYLQYVGEEILFSQFDENQTVMEYLISNGMFDPQMLDTIKHHPEVYDYLIKYKKHGYVGCLSSEILMQEKDGKILLDSLLDNGYRLYALDIINEDMIKILLKYGLEHMLSNVPYDLAFIEVEGTDKKLFEYLTERGILCYEAVAGAIEKKEHIKEVIDILEENGRLFMLQNLDEEQLLETYGRETTLLETLLENHVSLTNMNVTKKETFDLLVAYSRYDELCRSSEEMLLQIMPSGKKLYEELISQRKNIETEGINNEEITDAILNQSDIRLIHCIGTERLLSNYTLNKTYLDIILRFAKEHDRKILGYLRYEDATVNEFAKIIIAHTKFGYLHSLKELDKEILLDNSTGTTLLEELLREDEELTTYTILNSELRSDIEIATILKLHGINQRNLTYDEEYKPQYTRRYIQLTIDNYKSMQITEEQEILLQELYTIMNDGQTPPEILDMMIASYRNLFATNNPYANEVTTIIEMKKQNPGFHIEFTDDGACYRETEKTIYLDDLNPQVFHHELGHAFFHMMYNKYMPEEFKDLLRRLNRSTITRIRLENYDRAYHHTSSKVSDRIREKLDKLNEIYDIDAIEDYLSSFTDGLEERLISKGYNPALVKRILGETYTTQEFLEQEKRIVHGEMLDVMLRVEHSSVQGLGDFFDGIYKGAYHDGTITGILSGARISGYGHGRSYYSQGIEYVFDEMIANYSAIVKMSGPEEGMKKLEQYLGKELAKLISTTYNQMALQNNMTQSINQTQIRR